MGMLLASHSWLRGFIRSLYQPPSEAATRHKELCMSLWSLPQPRQRVAGLSWLQGMNGGEPQAIAPPDQKILRSRSAAKDVIDNCRETLGLSVRPGIAQRLFEIPRFRQCCDQVLQPCQLGAVARRGQQLQLLARCFKIDHLPAVFLREAYQLVIRALQRRETVRMEICQTKHNRRQPRTISLIYRRLDSRGS